MSRLGKMLTGFLCLLATLLPCASVMACMAFFPAEGRVRGAYERNSLAAVLLVRVNDANDIILKNGRKSGWEASASVVHILRGNFSGSQAAFQGNRGTSACDFPYAKPENGDEWVVYVARRPDWVSSNPSPDGPTVLHAFPADIAFKIDPNIQR
jgi:hypothetical protein